MVDTRYSMTCIPTNVLIFFTIPKADLQNNARPCVALRRHALALAASQLNARIDSNPIPALRSRACQIDMFCIRYFRSGPMKGRDVLGRPWSMHAYVSATHACQLGYFVISHFPIRGNADV